MKPYGHWDTTQVYEFDPDDWFGFIYEIKNNNTGRRYIGRKQIHLKRNTIRDAWQTYTGSSAELNADIKMLGEGRFTFTILRLCSGKAELTYMEEKTQYERDVLFARLPNGERAYYNKTIGHRHFAGVEKHSEETRRKIALKKARYGLGSVRSPETRAKMAKAKRERPVKIKTRQKLSDHFSQTYIVTHPDGHQETITSMKAFCAIHSLNAGAMAQVALGKKPMHKGYRAAHLKAA